MRDRILSQLFYFSSYSRLGECSSQVFNSTFQRICHVTCPWMVLIIRTMMRITLCHTRATVLLQCLNASEAAAPHTAPPTLPKWLRNVPSPTAGGAEQLPSLQRFIESSTMRHPLKAAAPTEDGRPLVNHHRRLRLGAICARSRLTEQSLH